MEEERGVELDGDDVVDFRGMVGQIDAAAVHWRAEGMSFGSATDERASFGQRETRSPSQRLSTECPAEPVGHVLLAERVRCRGEVVVTKERRSTHRKIGRDEVVEGGLDAKGVGREPLGADSIVAEAGAQRPAEGELARLAEARLSARWVRYGRRRANRGFSGASGPLARGGGRVRSDWAKSRAAARAPSPRSAAPAVARVPLAARSLAAPARKAPRRLRREAARQRELRAGPAHLRRQR